MALPDSHSREGGNPAALTQIDDCLRRQLDAGAELIEQLRREAEAFKSGDAARVEEVLPAKQNALHAFAVLDQERQRLFSEAGCDDFAKAGEWLAARGRSEATQAKCKQLLALATECARQNQVNGQLIQAGLRHTRQVLDLLRGRPPEEAGGSYGPGQNRSAAASPGHSLGKA